MNSETQSSTPIRSLRHVGVCYKRREGLFRFNPFWALRDVSFDLFRGEALGVIGRNGAGKTTLLQLLAEIIKPDHGELYSDGSRATLLTLQLGFIPHLSGRENALMSGLLLGLRRQEIEHRVPEVQAFSELGDFFDQPVREYSAGMRARLGFSVALQMNPDIFLVDEVLGVGDADFRKKSAKAMRKRFRTDCTIVVVSHEFSTIHQLCDRVVWIEQGATREIGTPSEVIRAYRDHLRIHTSVSPNSHGNREKA